MSEQNKIDWENYFSQYKFVTKLDYLCARISNQCYLLLITYALVQIYLILLSMNIYSYLEYISIAIAILLISPVIVYFIITIMIIKRIKSLMDEKRCYKGKYHDYVNTHGKLWGDITRIVFSTSVFISLTEICFKQRAILSLLIIIYVLVLLITAIDLKRNNKLKKHLRKIILLSQGE